MGWIRDKLRAWLMNDAETTPEPILRCIVPAGKRGTEHAEYLIQGSSGLRLTGVPVGRGTGQGVRLIAENQAIDKDQFWSLWRKFNPGAILEWKDGEEFVP